MQPQMKFRIAVSILVCFVLHAQGADNYTDNNRPYEFGFNVEVEGMQQQHRHEKKDKDGIIMGEFGFITADDVYHVTVYATDKEGRFKILSMKNIHLKSSPAPAGLTARQGHSLALPASAASPAATAAQAVQPLNTPQAIAVTEPPAPYKQISLEPPGRACSSCSLPTTTTRAPPFAPPASFAPQNQQTFPASSPALTNSLQQGGFGSQPHQVGQQNYPQQQSFTGNAEVSPQQPGQPQGNYQASPINPFVSSPPSSYSQSALGQPGLPQNSPAANQNSAAAPQSSTISENFPSAAQGSPAEPQNFPGVPQNSQGAPQSSPAAPQSYPGAPQVAPVAPQNFPGQPALGSNAQQGGPNYSNGASPIQSSSSQGGPGGRTSKQYTGGEQQFNPNVGPNGLRATNSVLGSQPASVKPTLVTAQMQIVDKNTDIHALRPGEKAGLPAGLNKDDITQLLYTFNYTVGFHGHFEEGYTNGVKKGYYFVTGRNGVKTRIDYVADDTGFHPKISQEVLDLLSDDVPKPETEKDEKYGLKGYEFKWLYYPVDS